MQQPASRHASGGFAQSGLAGNAERRLAAPPGPSGSLQFQAQRACMRVK